MISRMAKPEEVLVVENEQGEVVREFMRDTDSINMYKNMRETLGEWFLKRFSFQIWLEKLRAVHIVLGKIPSEILTLMKKTFF